MSAGYDPKQMRRGAETGAARRIVHYVDSAFIKY